MVAMKYLSVFDGSVGYRDSGTTGTLTNDGALSYATSVWAGHQGLVTPEKVSLASVANAAVPTAGAAIVRLKAPASIGAGNKVILTLGTSSTGVYLFLKFNATTGNLFAAGNSAPSTPASLDAGVAPGLGADTCAYLEWTTTRLAIGLGTGALSTLSVGSAGWFPPTGLLTIGALNDGTNAYPAGRIDAVALFDGPLTDAQRTYLATTTTPWTWGMALSAPIAGYIDVLPSAGANTGAPVLTLP